MIALLLTEDGVGLIETPVSYAPLTLAIPSARGQLRVSPDEAMRQHPTRRRVFKRLSVNAQYATYEEIER